MHDILQTAALLLVSVPMALALAHGLELPGKMRLARDEYFVTQKIYYPGFTLGGIAEFVSIPALLALAWATPPGPSRWLTLAACAALIGMQAVYWTVTHPVNKVWTADAEMSGAGTSFFGAGQALDGKPEWTALRDRWEYSHVARAALGFAALAMLAYAIAR